VGEDGVTWGGYGREVGKGGEYGGDGRLGEMEGKGRRGRLRETVHGCCITSDPTRYCAKDGTVAGARSRICMCPRNPPHIQQTQRNIS
jgi:hypothetical protein